MAWSRELVQYFQLLHCVYIYMYMYYIYEGWFHPSPSIFPPFSFPLLLLFSLSYMFLSLALRYVLDSLKKPPNKKMYLFGLAALDKFKGRLKEFPQYCASIASIPHFNHSEFPPVLRQVVGVTFFAHMIVL